MTASPSSLSLRGVTSRGLTPRGLTCAALAAGLLMMGCGGKSGGYPDASVQGTGGSVGPATGGRTGAGTGGAGVGTGGMGMTASGGATPTGGAIAPGQPIPIDSFGAEIVAAGCAFNARCGVYPDVASCAATNWLGAGILTLQADVAAGRVTYDPAKAATCLAAVRAQPCTQSEAAAAAAMPDQCDGITTGTVALGQTCYITEECVGTAVCVPPSSCTAACCAGTCVAPVASGASCASAPCVAGTYCRQVNATTLRCTPKSSSEGAACDAADACVPPLFCVLDEGGATGSCVKGLPATGAACNVNSGCNDVFRDYCASTNVCTKMLAVGQPCTAGTETTPDPCVWYAYCSGGVCKAFGGAGAVCATFTDGVSDCLGGQVCPAASKTCSPPAASSSCR